MYKAGTWNSICAVCGFEFKADQLIQRWDGVYTCKEDWEPRHVLDFFTAPPPERTIPWTQRVDDDYALTTEDSGVLEISASLTETIHQFDAAATTIGLPSANDSAFVNSSVVYQLINTGDVGDGTVSPATGSIQGSATVSPGTTAYFRNIPSQNIWIRES
jgi:hypothetical protein